MNYLVCVYRDIAVEASNEEEARSKLQAMMNNLLGFGMDIKESIEAEEIMVDEKE
jgi:hypothetical protein